jgi:2C-methyl-D-erythritol 2,4-cyclodiphosphate synthase
MRPALLLAAALALGASPLDADAQPSSGPSDGAAATTVTDVRCVIVSGTLAQSDDPQMKAIGYASLLYFWGRLEGRGATDNVAALIIGQAQRMTPEDVKSQEQICNALVTGAGQSLQDLSNTLQKELGGRASPGR